MTKQTTELHGPFPVDTLPDPLKSFVQETADAIGCDAALVALPTLATTAAAIGSARRVTIKRGWGEPSILWCLTVARSGSAKSPACDSATEPLEAVERAEVHAASQSEGESAIPVRVVADTTREALDVILSQNESGLLLTADEASSFIGGIDRYGSGKSSDAGRWLPLWQAKAVRRHRATGDAKRVFVPNPHLSFAGCITPGGMTDFVRSQHNENGLLARMLIAMPNPRAAQWTDREPSVEAVEGYAAIIETLAKIPPDRRSDGTPWPRLVRLAKDARAVFIPHFNWTKTEAAKSDDAMAAMLSKLAGQTARIALVFSMASDPDSDVIRADSMERAVELARWFASERRSIEDRLSAEVGDFDQSLVAWIAKWCRHHDYPGITPAQLNRNRKGSFRSSDDAEQALADLALRGLGKWENSDPGPTGGRPTRRFVPTGLR